MTGQPGPRADITVIGEAIIDLVPGAQPQTYHAAPGGSPYKALHSGRPDQPQSSSL